MALNSLFIGLSGIQVHQTRTNVVADNLANINTTGFKSRRANFQDMLAQTFREATGPEAGVSGTNPTQVGTGVRIKSIDTNFAQGSIQATGRQTDLAIEGDGFFILGSGANRFYTRDGAFAFDALGRLINPNNGMTVQGNVADATGNFGATTGLVNVQVDLNQEIPGVSTSRVNLSGNIDPGPVSSLTTGTEFYNTSVLTAAAPPTSTAAEKVEILINTSEGLISGIISMPVATYSDVTKYVDALNAAIAGNERLAGNVIAQVDPTTSTSVQLRTTFGGTDVQLGMADLSATGAAVASLGFTGAGTPPSSIAGKPNVQAGAVSTVAVKADILNDLAQVGSFLSSGDLLRFSGTRSDGTTYTGTFTFDPGGAGATNTALQDFTNVVAAAFGDNVDAAASGLDATGKIRLVDTDGNTVTGWTINITLEDADTGHSSGLIGASGLSQHKISTTVFDSQGRSHTMNVTLSETPVANRWTYNVSIDNQPPAKAGSGTAVFDEDGSVRSFVPVEGEGTFLEFTPDGGVLPMQVDFTGISVADRGINGLTQFAAPSTADVVDQNGRSSGRLDNLFIRTDGVIEGRFTNGETLALARVNLANFDNPGGLRRVGGNLYSETENTGSPLVEIATKTIESQIVAEAVELSNVDLAQELVDLIISQRGFQANARVVTTTDQILAETVNLKQ